MKCDRRLRKTAKCPFTISQGVIVWKRPSDFWAGGGSNGKQKDVALYHHHSSLGLPHGFSFPSRPVPYSTGWTGWCRLIFHAADNFRDNGGIFRIPAQRVLIETRHGREEEENFAMVKILSIRPCIILSAIGSTTPIHSSVHVNFAEFPFFTLRVNVDADDEEISQRGWWKTAKIYV